MAAHPMPSGRTRARRPEFELDRRSPWLDTLIVAGIFASILFNLLIGPLTVLVVFGAVGAFCVLRWERLPAMVMECWPLLLFPAMVMLSALWSDVPLTTLRYGLLYCITAFAGIIVGGGTHRSAYVNGHFLAFAVYSVASILFGRWVGWGEGAGDAYAGLVGSKNASGDMAGVATLVTIVFIRSMFKSNRRAAGFASIALLPILGWLLVSSRATGALIATILASGCLIAWLVSERFERQVRGGIFIGATSAAVLALITQQWWLGPIFDLVLNASGKDAGLTGRSDLWAFGSNLIAERPWLGLGYNAFWLHDNIDARYLWAMMGIKSQQGFNFHNTVMEIVIHLGYVGLGVAAVMAAAGVSMLLSKTLRTPELSSILAFTLCLYFSVKMPFEVIGYDPMHFTTVTMYALFAVGLRRDGAVARRLISSKPRPSRLDVKRGRPVA
ncbi:O-antigen ligase family protein [Aurantiacibacter suaedae]|uniref:O-antigen ligase family protein n=1 Tax=Aurantiacibacter suaedae TaxID=2545755 RepID=UPI0010F43564|nr:O-antigen ligase family protein [Aurantiacibacter suaedae]